MSEAPRMIAWIEDAGGTVASSEVMRAGFHSQTLTRLVQDGVLERVARGVYRLSGAEISEWHGLVLAAKAAPGSVVCLLSALAFHEVGTQLPDTVWLAIARGRHTPRVNYPRARFVHLSGRAFTEGIEEHVVEGQTLRVYGLAKTLADCFKFRNRIGLDVAIEALTDSWRQKRVRAAELDAYARINRVARIMKPYIEALAG